MSVVKKITEYLGLENYNVTDGDPGHFSRKSQWFKDRSMHITEDAEIYDWLKIIIDSDFVITDSYHATCFCIMFRKPFVLLQERWALSRIESIMNIFKLHDRWVKVDNMQDFILDTSWFESIGDIDDILNKQINDSYEWLKKALTEPKPLEFNNKFDAWLPYSRVEDYFYFLMRDRSNYIVTVSSCNVNKEVLDSIDFKSKLSFMNFDCGASSSFAFLVDFDKDYIEVKNSNIGEISYMTGNTNIRVLVDNSEPKTNNLYTFNDTRRVSKLNTEANLIISIYSKIHGKFVDSFEVILENGVANIKR